MNSQDKMHLAVKLWTDTEIYGINIHQILFITHGQKKNFYSDIFLKKNTNNKIKFPSIENED